MRTGVLPLWTIQGPDTDSVLVLGVIASLEDFDEASTKVLPPFGDLAKGNPVKLFLPGARSRLPVANAETRPLVPPCGRLLENIVHRLHLRVVAGQERLVSEPVVTIGGCATWALCTGNGTAVRGSRGRRLRQVIHHGAFVDRRGHCVTDGGMGRGYNVDLSGE